MGRAQWSRLTAFLENSGDVVPLSWDELADIVGGLPASAVDHYPQWWHGDRPNTRAWRAAGFEADDIVPGVRVTFRKSGRAMGGATATTGKAAPVATRRADTVALKSLAGIDPRQALLVIPCSGAKRTGGEDERGRPGGWTADLLAARRRVAPVAHLDETRVMPACDRYEGSFYQAAGNTVQHAVKEGNVVILSGGYGLLAAEEHIGTYDRALKLSDWPAGALEQGVADAAADVGSDVVAFASATTSYSRLLRRVPWRLPEGRQALLVTVQGVQEGAMSIVPRLLGEAFAAFWDRRHDAYPPKVSVERLA